MVNCFTISFQLKNILNLLPREGSQDGGGLPGEATTLVQQFCADPPANQVRQTIGVIVTIITILILWTLIIIIIWCRCVGNGEA